MVVRPLRMPGRGHESLRFVGHPWGNALWVVFWGAPGEGAPSRGRDGTDGRDDRPGVEPPVRGVREGG